MDIFVRMPITMPPRKQEMHEFTQPDTERIPPIGEARNRELLKGATTHVYRSFLDRPALSAFCYSPAAHPDIPMTPAILFFHSGLWDRGHASQFVPQCLHFASRGCFAATIEYRIGNDPVEAISDAQSAVLWLKKNAEYFRIDPDKIIVVGGAAGAHMALSTALVESMIPSVQYNPVPAAIGQFSGVYDTSPKKGIASEKFLSPQDAKNYSPLELVRKNLPPLFMVHAKNDRLIPFDQAQRFAKAYKRKKNEIEFLPFEGVEHSFYNFNVSEKYYEICLEVFDSFLVRQGLIEPDVVF